MARLEHTQLPSVGPATVYSLTLGELAEEPQKDCPEINRKARRDMLTRAFTHYTSQWMGGLQGWAEAGGMLEQGWPEGAARLAKLAGRLAAEVPQARSIRRQPAWAEDGDEVCHDRLRSGQIDQCWRSMRRQACLAPQTVVIETMWGGSFGQSSEELFWQGATAAVATDVLEAAGYRVELNANCFTAASDGHHLSRLKIKESAEPVRPDGIAAALCHAGIFRTYGFLCIEHCERNIGGWGHGGLRILTPKDATALNYGVETLFVGRIATEDQAVESIKQFVRKLEGND